MLAAKTMVVFKNFTHYMSVFATKTMVVIKKFTHYMSMFAN